MEKTNEKELEYFRLVGYTHSDNYTRYRRLTEFDVKVKIAEDGLVNEIAVNLLNQSAKLQKVYLLTLFEKLDKLQHLEYADYQEMLGFLAETGLEWRKLDAFFRTLSDFYILELKEDGGIGYFNKEPNIPTDYDSPEMAFLNKGIGYLTDDDAEKTKDYIDKYGKYTRDSWDVHSRDILAEEEFLKLVVRIWEIVPGVPMEFPRSACGEVEDRLSRLKFYVFNALQGNSLKKIRDHLILRKKMLAQEQGTASFEHFDRFIDELQYNYPVKYAVASYVHQWRENLKFLKKEILDNMILLDDSAKGAYLERISFGCRELVDNVYAVKSDIDGWLDRYHAQGFELFSQNPFIANEINTILTSEVPKFHDAFEEGFNLDTESIQHCFYNYYYGEVLFEALNFVELKAEKLNPAKTDPTVRKMKTSLTVGQLSLFFKLMMEENLLSYKAKTDVYKFISEVYATERQESISSDSVKNKMDLPNEKDIDVIKEKLLHMLQILQKIQEKK